MRATGRRREDVLLAAIAAGGSSLRDFVQSDGSPGYFQQHYYVYDARAPVPGLRGRDPGVADGAALQLLLRDCQKK